MDHLSEHSQRFHSGVPLCEQRVEFAHQFCTYAGTGKAVEPKSWQQLQNEEELRLAAFDDLPEHLQIHITYQQNLASKEFGPAPQFCPPEPTERRMIATSNGHLLTAEPVIRDVPPPVEKSAPTVGTTHVGEPVLAPIDTLPPSSLVTTRLQPTPATETKVLPKRGRGRPIKPMDKPPLASIHKRRNKKRV